MKLKVENLNQQAYEALKDKILHKEFRPGDRLVDSQLAEEFGISRTPLRDAIRKLAEEGLVVNPSGKGYYVYQPSTNDINEIFEMRLILDKAAITKLITEIFPNNPSALEELKERFNAARDPNRSSAFIANDENFHDTIIRLTGNSRMQAIYSDLKDQTRIFRRVTSHNVDQMDKAHDYHSKIFYGLINLDLDTAIAAAEKHVEYSRDDALTYFAKEYPYETKE